MNIRFIKSFFEELNLNNIRYCILRKLNEILKGEAHDIDMVVDYKKINKVKDILEKLSKKYGCKKFLELIKDNGNLTAIHFFLIDDAKNIYIVHFDLFKTFSWNGIVLIDNEKLLEKRICDNGIYLCNRSIEAITKLFSRYLYQGYIKNEYKNDISLLFLKNETEIKVLINLFLDNELVEIVYNFVIGKMWEELIGLRMKVQNSIQKKYCNTILKKCSIKLNNYCFKLKRYVNYKGIMVSFIGTDGTGKSTIIQGLSSILENTFNDSQIKYYHWRPKYIKGPKKEKISNTMEPHKKKPYNKVVSLLKFLYFNLDYIIGYWMSVRIHLGKNELVVFDRYYYDYLVDKYRYRLDINDTILKIFSHIIPKPNITFLLIGDAKTLYERKKELPIEEVQKQIDKIIRIKNFIPNSQVINVNETIDKVLIRVSTDILEYMRKREENI